MKGIVGNRGNWLQQQEGDDDCDILKSKPGMDEHWGMAEFFMEITF